MLNWTYRVGRFKLPVGKILLAEAGVLLGAFALRSAEPVACPAQIIEIHSTFDSSGDFEKRSAYELARIHIEREFDNAPSLVFPAYDDSFVQELGEGTYKVSATVSSAMGAGSWFSWVRRDNGGQLTVHDEGYAVSGIRHR